MKNLKTTIITTLLLLAMVSGAVAQEKIELANVTYTYCPGSGNKPTIEITTPGGFEKKKMDFSNQEKSEANLTFLFTEIGKLQEVGWEIAGFNSYGSTYSCYATTTFLKRNKKQ